MAADAAAGPLARVAGLASVRGKLAGVESESPHLLTGSAPWPRARPARPAINADVGALLALPGSVWESWPPHLGAPELKSAGRGIHRFAQTELQNEDAKGWILVFEVDDTSLATPNPIRIHKTIQANLEVLAHLAFERAPQESMKMLVEKDSIRTIIRRRITEFWPSLLESPSV
jgi:hypothetical protein